MCNAHLQKATDCPSVMVGHKGDGDGGGEVVVVVVTAVTVLHKGAWAIN